MKTEDKDRVLKDGEALHVPLLMMDGVQRALARRVTNLTDALGVPEFVGRRQGYAFATNRSLQRDEAYERRSGVLAASWCVR